MLKEAKSRARKRGLPFNLTRKWLSNAIDDGVCQATGLPFVFNVPRHPFMPTLDQVRPSGGYVFGNVRVVAFVYNLAKNSFTDDTVLQMAHALVRRSSL
jgi:hypothetical protein